MADPYGYRYIVAADAIPDPGPGGLRLSPSSATGSAIGLSVFDADGGVHPDLELAPAGATLRIVAQTPAGEWTGTLALSPADMGYWFDAFATFADTTTFPPEGVEVRVYLPDIPGVGAWVTAPQILEAVGNTAATGAETSWAIVCADAINAGFDRALSGSTVTGTEPELVAQARRAGAELYKSREAPFGVTGFADLSGTAIRLARDPLEASWPVLRRYAAPGFA